MRGTVELVARNSRVQFKLSLRRNVTVLRGRSATGKSTLVRMVADYEEYGADSGVELRCPCPCTVLSGRLWRERLESLSGSVVFVDEGSGFVSTPEFGATAAGTDNYFVIVSREPLRALPYSVEEVYSIGNDTRATQRYPRVTRYYSSLRRIYGRDPRIPEGFAPEEVIVEDSGSGYQFFSALCARSGVRCVSAGGSANVFRAAAASDASSVLVVADGAAFGPEMDLMDSLRRVKDVVLYLPESFEWLLLSSGMVRDDELPAVLADPGSFIESRDYFTWERFFTATLTRMTEGTPLHYGKSRLSEAWLDAGAIDAVSRAMPDGIL